jgi:hypothetical protein
MFHNITLSKKTPKVLNIIYKHLNEYNMTIRKLNIKIINDIIYDERKHLVCVFKDYLLWDENSDFLKR